MSMAPQAEIGISIGGVEAPVVSARSPALLADSAMLGVRCVVPDGLAAGPQPVVIQMGTGRAVRSG